MLLTDKSMSGPIKCVTLQFPPSYDAGEFLALLFHHNTDPLLAYSSVKGNSVIIYGSSISYARQLVHKVMNELGLGDEKPSLTSFVKKDFLLLGAIDLTDTVMEKYPPSPADRPGEIYEFINETSSSRYNWLMALCLEKEIETKYSVNRASLKPEMQFLISQEADFAEKKSQLLEQMDFIHKHDDQNRPQMGFREAGPGTVASMGVFRR